MGLTADIKAEIAGTTVTASNARRSEVGAMIRFAGKLRLGDNNPGRSPESLVVSLDVDSSDVAERARQHIVDLYDIHAVVSDRTQSSKKPVFEVEWSRRGEGLDVARRLGLLDRAGRPVRGLPPRIVHGTAVDCEAAWRGAFLVRGSVTEPGRSSALEVIAPQTAAAIGLIGCARRLGIAAKNREVRGAERVQVREGDAIGALLSRMGAHRTRIEWDEQRKRREAHTSTNRLANFDDANLRRSARAAAAAAARVQRATELLGDDIPEHLAAAGRLRTEHRHSSLEELGELADPPISKDAIAGRIRRLLSLADRRAAELGVPDTFSAVTSDLFDED